jgi:uncharacterized protein (DUF305 family)
VTAPLVERRGFNDADLRYARRALPAGRDAFEASDLAAAWASDSHLRAVARQVRAMQENDIGELTALLDTWGRQAGGLEDPEPETPTTRSVVAVGDLSSLSGLEIDRLFVESLVAHAEGALASARTEMIEGFEPAIRRVAEGTIRANSGYLAALGRSVPGDVPGGASPPLARLG